MKRFKLNFIYFLSLAVVALVGVGCTGNTIEVGERFDLAMTGTVEITQPANGGAMKSGIMQELVPITGTTTVEVTQNIEDSVEVEAKEVKGSGSSQQFGDLDLMLDPQSEPIDNTGEISKRDHLGVPFFQSFVEMAVGLETTAGVKCGGTFFLITNENPNQLTIDQGVALDCAGNEIVVVQDLELTLPPDFIDKLQTNE